MQYVGKHYQTDDEWLKTRLVFPWLLTPGIFFLINNSNMMVLQHNFKQTALLSRLFLCLLLYTSSILMVFRLLRLGKIHV